MGNVDGGLMVAALRSVGGVIRSLFPESLMEHGLISLETLSQCRNRIFY